MSAPYRVEVDVAGVSLVSQETDPAGYGLADPLVLQQSVPTVDLAPLVQQDPQEATVTVIAANSGSYSFALGQQVRVAVYASHAGGNNYAFWGRIAQLQAQPHDLGILYTLQCVDYMADLAELTAGRVDYPAENALVRVNRMLAENGIGAVLVEGVTPTALPNVSARVALTEGTVPLLEALEQVLAGWAEAQPNNELGVAASNLITTRYELRPNIVNPGGIAGQGTLDPVTPFKLSPIYRPQGWDPPARLSAVTNVHLTVDTANTSPSTDALILDAGAVEFPTLYTQQKGNAVQRVVVELSGGAGFSVADWSSWGTYFWLAASSVVEATVKVRETVLGTVLASMYRGSIQPDSSLQWTVGAITWLASRTQAASWQGPKLRRVCTIARVDAVRSSSHVPTGKSWMAGVVDSLRITVQAGEVTVGFTLAPMHYTNSGALVVPHQATFAAAALVGVTFAQLSTTDTFTDYLLLYA